ncbi:MAG: L-lactate dehydrogenase complex protein LldG [Frankiales bacterium]|jgi:L-lactate dehydrogenase complex protein LldG|nr:L-lactate dehydrogenase complex protein LldG [Frankiales bacterium]
MTAREDVLARIRAAKPTSVPAVPRGYRTSAPVDVEMLVERLEDYRAVVHRCAEAELPALLTRLLPGRTVVPDGFPFDGVRDTGLSARELDEIDAVVTTCTVAVAETGTIVLDGSAGQGRRALSLVPDRHVVVVRTDQVVQTVPEALARLDATKPQTWISGPSATSDIELERVEGVHGPRTLEVVLVQQPER